MQNQKFAVIANSSGFHCTVKAEEINEYLEFEGNRLIAGPFEADDDDEHIEYLRELGQWRG